MKTSAYADSEFDNCFLKFCPQNTLFWGELHPKT